MTYLEFHAVFIVPAIAALALLQPKPMGGIGARRAWGWIAVLALIAFVYTTAWDNYLVYRGVWSYGPDRVVGTLLYVPIEEYLFFILQPVLTGLWFMIVRSRNRVSQKTSTAFARIGTALAWGTLALIGAGLLMGTSTLYLGLILVWASPVLAGMAWLSGSTFWHRRQEWMLSVLPPTLYLWIADRVAIGLGIWDISDTYSLELDPFGLPIEEAVFFLVTNVMVVQGLMMFLPDAEVAKGRS